MDRKNAELEMLLAEYDMKHELAAERNAAVKERDGALAGMALLEDTLQKAAEGKIEAEKTLACYNNARALPSNDTVAQRAINAEKKAGRKNPAGRRGRRKCYKNRQ